MSFLDRYRTAITFGLVAAMGAGFIVFAMRQPPPGAIEVVLPPATATPAPTATPGPIRVYVCGAVQQPDVYSLPAGSLVKDAILAAGGATTDANLEAVNLALALQDQMQIQVPRRGETPAPAGDILSTRSGNPAPGAPSAGLINLNTASQQELETLPGIGPALAGRIIEHRPYRSPEQIMEVPGIGAATYAQLKDHITAP